MVAAMSLLVPVILALSLGSAIVVPGADGDCPSVPTTVENACHDACVANELVYQLCMDALRGKFHSRSINEVAEYGSEAAAQALQGYRHTADYAGFLQRNPALSGEEKAAYEFCTGEAYVKAIKAMDTVFNRLPSDCFDLGTEYMAALKSLEACRDRVVKLPPSSAAAPLRDMVQVDLNETLVAYYLGKLLGVP